MDTAEASVVRKVGRRLLWFLILLFICAYLDRINIGFAALAMNKSLRLTQTMFGVASTCLYLMLARYGARVWLARILITWGFASAATAHLPSFPTPLRASPHWRIFAGPTMSSW